MFNILDKHMVGLVLMLLANRATATLFLVIQHADISNARKVLADDARSGKKRQCKS
jgi:hypothetical protein